MAMDASICSGSGPNGADSRTEPTSSSLTLSTSRRDCRNPVQSFQSRSRERPPMIRNRYMSFLCSVLCLLCSFPSAFAQLTPEQALSVRQISDPHFSPDGSRVAFTVAEPPKGTESNRDVWVLDIKSGDVLRFTNAPKSDGSARWAPTGMGLAFISDRSGTNQIYLFGPSGGEPAQLT